jgi:uncharacterized protein YjbI with pentapeptide repeats
MYRTTHLLLLLCIISIFASGGLQLQDAHGGSCIPAERASLLSFKKGITSDRTNLLASWHGQDCCRWRGIRCSNRTGHVVRLHLRTPNLHVYKDPCSFDTLFGEISSSLRSLEYLEHIDLSMNCLSGPNNTFPEFLGSMENLRYLNLTGLAFSGRLPPQLGNLSRMRYLAIGQQDRRYESEVYSDNITWLTNLHSLKHLSIRGVNLSGIDDWPHTLNMIPSLRVVHLQGCSLDNANQSLPYLNLTKLEKLDLSWNEFDHSIEHSWFWKVTSLKHLNLQYTRLFGQFPDALANMTSLQVA